MKAMNLNDNTNMFDDLYDIWAGSENNIWKKDSREEDLSQSAGVEIHIEPDDATCIEDITSFIVIEDVMGSIKTKYSRQI